MIRKWFKKVMPVIACFVMALPASAQVVDELNLFSKDARDRAARDIAEIKRVHHANLLIETRAAPAIPDSIKKNTKEVDAFISKWAQAQFASHKANVYVIITEKPNKVRVQVGTDTQSKGYFRMEDADRLRDEITKNLKENKRDQALTDATSLVSSTMDRRPKANPAARQADAAAAPAAEKGSGISVMTILLWIGGFLLVFWLVRALIGALSGGGGGYGQPGYGYGGGGGGGGFFSSLMGGLFGAAAGMWMYNHFFGHSTPSAWGGGPSGGGVEGPQDTASTGTTGDWSPDGGNDAGGGGDWGGGNDAGGGGDWGGGDAGGGGDWGGGGGGDWGGGGGDFGGGGGDW